MPPALAGPSSPGSTKPAADPWQRWLRARVRLAPGALVQSPHWVQTAFEHAWAPVQSLARQVRCLPPGLVAFLPSCEGGWVAIVKGESRYVPGPASLRQRLVNNVAYVSIQDLARDNERPLHVIGHLVDHYLGSGGESEGPWFSDGAGLAPAWQQAAERLVQRFGLGYGIDEIAQSGSRDYFAQSLAWYCRDRRRLNVADPQIEKWFRTTLWSDAFWDVNE